MSLSTRPLEDWCELVVDCPHSTPEWTDTGVVVLRSQNIKNGRLDLTSPSYTTEAGYKERTKRATPRGGDLVITREAPMGEICRVPDGLRCCLGQRQVLLRPKENSDYLLYAIQSPYVQMQIRGHDTTGSTVSNLCIPDLKALRIPDLPNEVAVAKVLSTIDAKMELNQQINAVLEEMAKLLYDYWFVQYDFPMSATQAAALGKPHLKGRPYRASGGRMIWSQELKREVPEDWRVGTLGDLCDIFDGPHATPTKTESGPYYLSISSLENGRLDLTKSAHLSEGEFVKWTRRVTPTAGDVLFSYETRLGEAALMPAEIRACLGRRMGLLRPKQDQVSPVFLLHCYLSQAFQGIIRANVIQGATVERISLNDLPSFPILIPAFEQRDAASKILTPLHGKIAQNQRETQELTTLRDWLLPMLMNGQVTVG